MDPLAILMAGMTVVVAGILVLRLHAFLALMAGALLVGYLTPPEAIVRYAQAAKLSPEATARLAGQSTIDRFTEGFGRTCAGVGILIAMASVIGRCLLDSGAADRIVRSTLALIGEQRVGLGFMVGGYLLAIPVFFDTVFYLMIPLAKAAWVRLRGRYLLCVLAVVAGGSVTHSLVPPTPGPLATAEILKVNLGTMILAGCVVAAICSMVGFAYAVWAEGYWNIPVRDRHGQVVSLPAVADGVGPLTGESATGGGGSGESVAPPGGDQDAPLSSLPPLWLSVLPIALPVGLIGGATIITTQTKGVAAEDLSAPLRQAQWALGILGDRNIAMILAALAALALVIWQRATHRGELTALVSHALEEAGSIILITAAGGAFGALLQQTGIGPRVADLARQYAIPYVLLAWGLTVVIRAAQGSATVAMLTSAGILAGVADPAVLGFHPVYLALAIGCGSKPLSWMNDSGFWVICRMSGMTENETLRIYTPMTCLTGTTGLLVVMLGATLLPLT